MIGTLAETDWAGLTFSGFGEYSRFRSDTLTEGSRAVLYSPAEPFAADRPYSARLRAPGETAGWEIPRRNFLGDDVFPFRTLTGNTYDSGRYGFPLDRAAEAAGAHVLLNATADEVLFRNDRIHGVRTGSIEVHAPVVVNAAGPWAPEVAALADATPMPLRPRRRHIIVTRAPESVPPDWPFIWDIATEVYFRPEEGGRPEDGGLLSSPCDEAEPDRQRCR